MAYAALRARSASGRPPARLLLPEEPGSPSTWLACRAVQAHQPRVRIYERERDAPGALLWFRASIRSSVRPFVMTHFLDLMKQGGLRPSVCTLVLLFIHSPSAIVPGQCQFRQKW